MAAPVNAIVRVTQKILTLCILAALMGCRPLVTVNQPEEMRDVAVLQPIESGSCSETPAVYAVRSRFKGREVSFYAEGPPKALYLTPGDYEIEAFCSNRRSNNEELCREWAFLDHAPSWELNLSLAGQYELVCRSNGDIASVLVREESP